MGKRVFDLFFASLGLLFLSPIFLIVGLLIRKDGGPALFRQERVGQHGKVFRIYKFRSMVPDAERLGAQITYERDSRITRMGRFLRKSKIDEFPQLLNVFLGQISLVGPRPEVPQYVDKWSAQDRDLILSIKPGITDYASLCYSNEQEVLASTQDPEKAYIEKIMPHKLELYRRYAKERNLWLDLRIILATLAKIAGLEISALLPELKEECFKSKCQNPNAE